MCLILLLTVSVSVPFDVIGGIRNLIVSVPEHCSFSCLHSKAKGIKRNWKKYEHTISFHFDCFLSQTRNVHVFIN